MIVELMLTQAQEVFIEKILSEGKSGLLVSKLAMHVGTCYQSVHEGMLQADLKPQFPPTWWHLLNVKQNIFIIGKIKILSCSCPSS